MEASYFIALLFAAAAAVHPTFLRYRPPAWKIPTFLGTITICACLCALFAGKLYVIDDAAHHFLQSQPKTINLPILAIQVCDRLAFRGCDHYNSIDVEHTTAVEIIRIAQSAFLFILASILYGNPPHRRMTNTILGIAAAITATLAFFSPAMEGPDLYAYVAQAQITPSAYHPASAPFTQENIVLNHLWGLPLWPSPYGPLWIAVTKLTISPFPTLLGKLLALRFFEILIIALCAALIAILRLPYWVQATFIMNPMIYDTYVSEGHNDLFGASLVLAAAALYRRLPYLAILPAAAAGAVKLPYILIGMLAFSAEQSTIRRVYLGLSSAILACSVSILVGGLWYWQALRYIADLSMHPASSFEILLHITSALCAVALVGVAVNKRRFVTSAIWLIPSLGSGMLPQYLAWSFPYALLGEEPNFIFLTTLPITLHLLNTIFDITPIFISLRAILIALPTITIIRALLLRRLRAPDH